MKRVGEIALISDFLAPLATAPGAFGLRDDAALLCSPSKGLVVTTDALVAGCHFFEDDSPGDVAYKALATNVSDLAAKAAQPFAYTLTLAPSKAPSEAWAKDFAYGLERAQAAFGMSLIGGDTVTAKGAWWLSMTAFGHACGRGMVRRSDAKPGNVIFLSGTLGDAALGLKLRQGTLAAPELTTASRSYLFGRYRYPEPRLGLIKPLEAHASAAMDISDGLALDLSRLCAASGVSAEIRIEALPLSEAAKALTNAPEFMDTVIGGGDDYEILATVPPGNAAGFQDASAAGGVGVTNVGLIVEGNRAPRFLDAKGGLVTFPHAGFEHFKT